MDTTYRMEIMVGGRLRPLTVRAEGHALNEAEEVEFYGPGGIVAVVPSQIIIGDIEEQ